MSVNIYKVKQELNIIECKAILEGKEYDYLTKEKYKSTQFWLFLKFDDNEATEWKKMLERTFKLYQEDSIPSLLGNTSNTRAIVLIKRYNTLYLISFGLGYHDISELISNDFGLDFAERVLEESEIKTKSVDFFQDNKLKEIVDYRNKASATIGATEAFTTVTGHPSFKKFGTIITCGAGVSFQKSVVSFSNFFKSVTELCMHINDSIKLENKISLPRIKKISKFDTLSDALNIQLKKNYWIQI